MLAAALSPRVSKTTQWFGALVLLTVLVAGIVWALAPTGWQSFISRDQETDGTVATTFTIWLTNFIVVAVAPLLVGASAFGGRRGGHRRFAFALMVFVSLSELRNPVGIGFVGGLDPEWLLGAFLWWGFELLAIAVSCAAIWTMWSLTDTEAATRVLRRAIAQCAGLLAAAAVIEVVLT